VTEEHIVCDECQKTLLVRKKIIMQVVWNPVYTGNCTRCNKTGILTQIIDKGVVQ
jgi:hypothetical protein